MKKVIKRTLLFIIVISVTVAGVFVYEGYKLYETAINETSIIDMQKQIKENTENYTEIEDVPEIYLNALVAVEDKRFYMHQGVDIISIGRAVITDIKAKKLIEGGSTLTQQLAKNTYFSQKKEITRKIAEVFAAIQYEKELSKEDILELYINTCYYGDGYYSIADAALGYFDKDVEDMNTYECTLLVGIPNAPSVYAPTKNPELAKERQIQVLNKMLDQGFITEDEVEKISKEEYKNGR
jgi:membrane peptidoglycan carboxypeptidase